METPNKEPHNHRGFAADRVSFGCNTAPKTKGAPTDADADPEKKAPVLGSAEDRHL